MHNPLPFTLIIRENMIGGGYSERYDGYVTYEAAHDTNPVVVQGLTLRFTRKTNDALGRLVLADGREYDDAEYQLWTPLDYDDPNDADVHPNGPPTPSQWPAPAVDLESAGPDPATNTEALDQAAVTSQLQQLRAIEATVVVDGLADLVRAQQGPGSFQNAARQALDQLTAPGPNHPAQIELMRRQRVETGRWGRRDAGSAAWAEGILPLLGAVAFILVIGWGLLSAAKYQAHQDRIWHAHCTALGGHDKKVSKHTIDSGGHSSTVSTTYCINATGIVDVR
jgi:hypothetical protein